jgi:hypothetical protein
MAIAMGRLLVLCGAPGAGSINDLLLGSAMLRPARGPAWATTEVAVQVEEKAQADKQTATKRSLFTMVLAFFKVA